MTSTKPFPTSSLIKALIGAAVVVALQMAGLYWYVRYEPPMGGDFDLSYRGQAWRFSEQAKGLNILYIGYAKCPDVCPMTLSFTGQAFRSLSEDEKQKVRFLFLSVDYTHDRPDDVADYAAQFFPSFIGLSGFREQIDKTVSLFHASYIVEENPKSYLGYSISHPDRLYFLNKKGVVVATVSSPRSAEVILKTIKEKL